MVIELNLCQKIRNFMINYLNQAINRIKPSPTLAISAKASLLKKQGVDIIDLSVGEPDFPTPQHIQDAAIGAMRAGQTKYTPVDGTLSLKNAIIEKFKKENGLDYNLNEIIVSCGGKQVIFNSLAVTLSEDDEVIIPAPYWVSYLDIVLYAGGKPKIVECLQDDNFKLTAKSLKESINSKTKWLILNSPSNPTGASYTKDEIAEIAEVLRDFPDILILSDDIYEHLLYDQLEFLNLVQIAPDLKHRVLIVNGVSKSYSMTGWRIGYGAGPEWLIKAMAKIQSQSTSNPCSISQAAAVEALSGDQTLVIMQKKLFEKRRDIFINEINSVNGLNCRKPEGAFYLYVCVEGIIGKTSPDGLVLDSDDKVAQYFLENAKVSCVPGSAFGLSPYVRLSYAASEENLQEASRRIKKACQELS